MAIKKGDPVKIKAAWREAGDENFNYEAAEDQIEGRRYIRIVCVDSGLPLAPVETVYLSAIEGQDDADAAKLDRGAR